MTKKRVSKELINLIEEKYKKKNRENIKVGDLIKIYYKNFESGKERVQIYKGLIIAIQNKGLGKSFTLRRKIDGIGSEQIFLYHSPKILSIIKEFSQKFKKSKLYYLRLLTKEMKF
jgi:large subunit ribosomal protein L19